MHSYQRHLSARHFHARHNVNLPRRYSTREVTDGMASVLQARYGREKQPSVALSDDSGVNERTARNHLSGAHCMKLTDFFNACQAIPELKAWGARMMGLTPSVHPAFERELNSLIQTYYAIADQRENVHD